MNIPSSKPAGAPANGGPFGCHFIELGRHMAYLSGSAAMQVWSHGEFPSTMGLLSLKAAIVSLKIANEPEDPRTQGLGIDAQFPSTAVVGTGIPAFDILTNKVNPYLPDLDPVYRAIPQIVFGNYEKAIIIIERRIAELEAGK